MERSVVQIQMLGKFSLSYNGAQVDDSGDRSKKVWLLLAYLIYHRSRPVPQDELLDLLRNKEGANPSGALKTTLHRVRNVLDGLFPSAGHELILYKNGSYQWSNAMPARLDYEVFEDCFRQASRETDPDRRLELRLQAATTFRGDFLEKLSSEAWVVPICAYYHNLFLKTVLELLPELSARGRYEDAVRLCEDAVALEPYQEEFYQALMENLIQLGKQKRAVAVYEDLSRLLLNDFGTMPTEETRAIYRKALRTVNNHIIHLDMLRSQLEEESPATGAMICDYDFFRVLYQAEARAIVRNGNAVHIALLTVTDKEGEDLPKRSLDRAMVNLREQVRTNLRKGDIASRCSVCQFILMLPQANYENSCMVCRRIITAFNRQYPHSPARIDYAVQSLNPHE